MIKVENLYKSFGKLDVLEDINLEIETGQSLVIIGRSGCGKSVLLKLIVALLEPDKGRVLIDGENVHEMNNRKLNDFRKRIGILFQSGALFDSMTVGENVGFCLREGSRVKEEEVKEIVAEKLSLVGLSGIEDKMPSEISGGMKKRVALARAIAAEPKILLYDEPTTGLDPVTSDLINKLIVDINKQLGVISVAVTHDMNSAYEIADRMVMLYDRQVVIDGTPDEIKNTDNPVVRQFINGSSQGPIKVN